MNVVEKEFNQLAIEYESNRLSDWYKAHAAEILQHCDHIKEGDILDVGCGTGYLLREYLKDKPHVRAVGIDISSTMIQHATQKAKDADINQINFIHADWENIDFERLKSYNFTLIFCANTFHYFTQPLSASDKLFKQLTNNGKLYILERNKTASLLTLFWGILHKTLIKDQVVFYSTTQLVSFFRKAGFKRSTTIKNIKKYLWKNKLFTSIVIIEANKD